MRLIVAALVTAIATPALAITLCTTPDGKTYAGDNPPADCVVKSKYESTGEPSPAPGPSADEIQAAIKGGVSDAIDEAKEKQENAVLASAMRQRREIERELDRLEDELAGVNNDLANVKAVNPANYRNTTAGWQQYEQDLQNKTTHETRLHSKKIDLEISINREKAKFDRVTQELKIANGGVLPSSWRSLR